MTEWTKETYPYRGRPLVPSIMMALISQHFAGKTASRDEIIKTIREIHLDLGGTPPNSDLIGQYKKAKRQLLEKGLFENAGYGYIRSKEDTDDNKVKSDVLSENVTAQEVPEFIVDAEQWIGEGNELIYCYTFPAHRELAEFKQSKHFPIKVGRSADQTLRRVVEQCGTSNPEKPIVLLAMRTDDSSLLEKTIHKILECWDRKIDDAPGNEWFEASTEELHQIFDYLMNPHKIIAGTTPVL